MKQQRNNSISSAALALCVKPEIIEKYFHIMQKESNGAAKTHEMDIVPYSVYQELYQKWSEQSDEMSTLRIKVANLERKLRLYENR